MSGMPKTEEEAAAMLADIPSEELAHIKRMSEESKAVRNLIVKAIGEYARDGQLSVMGGINGQIEALAASVLMTFKGNRAAARDFIGEQLDKWLDLYNSPDFEAFRQKAAKGTVWEK